MARNPKFKYVKTASGWRINIPASMTLSGKRERHFHKTRDQAAAHSQELREKFLEHGGNASTITPSLAEDAVKAVDLLRPWNASILEAARLYVAHKEREGASVPVSEATAAFLLSCDGLRDRTVAGYRQVCARLDVNLGDRLLATITPKEIAEATDLSSSGSASANRYRCVRAFWRWSAKRKWCDVETFAAIQAPRVSSEGEISVLTVAEAAVLLTTAEEHFPEAVASYALQLFAGIRVEEIIRLESEHVSPIGIDITAAVAKKSRRRHITPSPTLAAWLEKHPFEPCPRWEEVNAACRRLAGWNVSSRLLKNPPSPTRGSWPQNVMRHSFASYAIAIGTPLEEMLFSFGHTGGPALLRQNYLGRASKKDALAYFELTPKGVKIPKLQTVEGAA